MGNAQYSAAKEGIIGFTRTVAREVAEFGVTCNAIRPRALTRMSALTVANLEKLEKQGIVLPQRVRDIPTLAPEAVAPLMVYLASDEAAHINGYDFFAGGGTIALLSQPEEAKTIHKEGIWTVEELCQLMPKMMASALVKSAP